MRSIGYSAALLAEVWCHTPAQAANPILRVACDDDSVGAEVLIDDKFKGECPLDGRVPEGTITLRAFKKVDALRERSFEQQIRIVEGTIKSIEVQLGPVELNAEGRRREAERLAAQRATQAEARRRDEALWAHSRPPRRRAMAVRSWRSAIATPKATVSPAMKRRP